MLLPEKYRIERDRIFEYGLITDKIDYCYVQDKGCSWLAKIKWDQL